MIFIPYEAPSSPDGRFCLVQPIGEKLRSRRKQLGLTQQATADMARIQLKQYQRLEGEERQLAGCSMRIGLAVCSVLLLDPYEILDIDVEQADPDTMKPVEKLDIRLVEKVSESSVSR